MECLSKTQPGVMLRGEVKGFVKHVAREGSASHPGGLETFRRLSMQIERQAIAGAANSDRTVVTSFENYEALQSPQFPDAAAVFAPIDYGLTAIYEDPSTERDLLKAALKQYRDTVEDCARIDFREMESGSWQEVVKAAQRVVHDKVRSRLANFMGDNAATMKAWLEILPAESEYFSIICGTLKLVLGAFARDKEVNETIAAALTSIPEIFSSTNRIVALYQKYEAFRDNELHLRSAKLLSAVLALLSKILFHVNRSKTKKFINCFVKQRTYGKSIDQALAVVRERKEQFKELQSLLQQNVTLQTLSSVTANREDMQRVVAYQNQHSQQNEIRAEQHWQQQQDDFAEQHRRMSLLALGVGEASRLAGEGNHRVEQRLQQIDSRVSQVSLQMESVIPRLLAGNPRINPMTMEDYIHARQAWEQAGRLSVRLGIDLESVRQDVASRLELAHSLTREARARAVYLLRLEQFTTWILQPHSSALVIHGSWSGDAMESPMSFASAKLASALTSSSGMTQIGDLECLVITFFCGEHVWDGGQDSSLGPVGLMHSLIAQLVSLSTDIDFALLKRAAGSDLDDIGYLCDIFAAIVRQLPNNVILVCIVDAITAFEDVYHFATDAQLVVRTLVALCQAQSSCGPIVKALFACPSSSRLFDTSLSEDDWLVLPDHIHADFVAEDVFEEMLGGDEP